MIENLYTVAWCKVKSVRFEKSLSSVFRDINLQNIFLWLMFF